MIRYPAILAVAAFGACFFGFTRNPQSLQEYFDQLLQVRLKYAESEAAAGAAN